MEECQTEAALPPGSAHTQVTDMALVGFTGPFPSTDTQPGNLIAFNGQKPQAGIEVLFAADFVIDPLFIRERRVPSQIGEGFFVRFIGSTFILARHKRTDDYPVRHDRRRW